MPNATRKQLRVFIGIRETAGYFRGLERGFADIGINARFYNLSPNPFGYGGQGRQSVAARVLRLRDAPPRTWRARAWALALLLNRTARSMRTAFLLPWALIRYDAFVLGGDQRLLGGLELPLMRALKRPVVFVFNGTDHRPPYLSGRWIRQSEVVGTQRMARDTRIAFQRVKQAERYAAAIVALPSSAQFHELPFVNFLAAGIPVAPNPNAVQDQPASRGNGVVRVLHAPSYPIFKGTEVIRRAVDDIRRQGVQIEYREISGKPHAEVLSALRWADFVVDQVYSDTPMAGFVTEAAHYGKPAVIGGYYARHLPQEVPPDHVPPSLFCLPDELPQALATMATDKEFRLRMGTSARQWVTERWSPAAVAGRFVRLLAGEIPDEWMVEPKNLSYALGWGVPEGEVRRALTRFVADHGVEALRLAHNPRLQQSVLALTYP